MSLTLEKFDCEGDPSSVGARWERWKRALFIYLEASGIDSIEKKKASLLHFGGLELQEIFYNLPENDIESIGNADAFEVAIRKLDAYFAPKQSKLYEWHLFRLLRQDPNEKFDKFLVTLRQQADKCQFRDKDDHIVDPITEKCSSNELRKRMLQTGDAITLNIIIAEANALEAVNRQMEEFGNKFEGNQSVNKIDSRSHKVWTTNRTGCRRCGNPKHTSQDAKCPAKERSCLKCGLSGHFRQYCRTRHIQKRKGEDTYNKTNNHKRGRHNRNSDKVNQIEDRDSEDMNYVFYVDDDLEFECRIGGVDVKMLVDSGCKDNVITSKTWQEMKRRKVIVSNHLAKPDKTFSSYGSKVQAYK
nr:unnamed protein product [Callosobruchus analis]